MAMAHQRCLSQPPIYYNRRTGSLRSVFWGKGNEKLQSRACFSLTYSQSSVRAISCELCPEDYFPSISDVSSPFSSGFLSFKSSSMISHLRGDSLVCFGGGQRLRKPRIWKTKQRRGSIAKSDKLLECIESLSNVKEEVYGALDAYIAWELDFPLIPVRKALRTLEMRGDWSRVIQVSKWMLGKGQGKTLNTYFLLLKAFSHEGRIDEAQALWQKVFSRNLDCTPMRFFVEIMRMYERYGMENDIIEVFADMEELGLKLDSNTVQIVSNTYEKLGMPEKAERVRLKYPSPAYRWRTINGKIKRFPNIEPESETKALKRDDQFKNPRATMELNDTVGSDPKDNESELGMARLHQIGL